MDKEEFVTLHFPVAGIDLSKAFFRQPNRDVGNGVYGRSCVSALNVRGFEATAERRRGGTRAGLAKYIPTPVIADWLIQHLNTIVWTSTAAKS